MIRYFISDLHLQPTREDLAAAFYGFVEHTAADADELYILGDFFDAWIGDDEDDPFYRHMIERLHGYTGQGLKIRLQHGNRDFLIGARFSQETGVELLDEQVCIDLNGQRALLMHGDSLCTDDADYMAFRSQVRSPQWQQQILAKPLAERRAMAAHLRAQSSSMNAMKAEDITDVNPGEVDKALRHAESRLLIHGHTHRPCVHDCLVAEQPAKRYVLGDWGDKGWYLRADGENIALRDFPI